MISCCWCGRAIVVDVVVRRRQVSAAAPVVVGRQASIARSSRSSVRSYPSATSVSNSGGVAVRPVTATRIAMNRSPAFQPRSSARARSGGSSSSASKLTAPTSAIVARAAAAPRRSSRRPSASARASPGSTSRSSTHRNPTSSPIAPSRGSRSWTTGSSAWTSSSAGHPVDPAGVAARPARNGRSRSTRSSGSRRRIHWPLSHSRRSRSKTAPALWTSRDVEPLDDLVDREDLVLRAGRPPEQGQVVDERLADEALGAVVVDRRLALALAHLRPVGVEDERQVGERRHLVAERPEQQDVLGRVRDVVLAADDVGHLHRRVVDDDGEVVQRRPVRADDDEVAADVRDVDLDSAADDVVPGDDALADAEAERALRPSASKAARSAGVSRAQRPL